jgi:hypothetical protein
MTTNLTWKRRVVLSLLMPTLALVCLTLNGLASELSPARRVWQSSDGLGSIVAELVELDRQWAMLRRDDGRLFAVSPDRLSADDQAFLAGPAISSFRYCLAQDAQARPPAPERHPLELSPVEIEQRIARLIEWRGQLEGRLFEFLKERPGEKGILRTRLEMSLSLTYLELAYWTIDKRSSAVPEATTKLVGWADDLMSEIDDDLLNDSDKRVKRILELWRRRVSDRQIASLENRLLAMETGVSKRQNQTPNRPLPPQPQCYVPARHGRLFRR